MIRGSCLCGAIRYQVDGPLGSSQCCHCTDCRKASGSAFAANASARRGDVTIDDTRGLLREYESRPGKFRGFCGGCGSQIYSRHRDRPDTLRIRMGTLDDDPVVRPDAHIWVASRAPWFEISDELPRFDRDRTSH